MKVIVVSEVGFGGSITRVYRYSKKKYIELVESELEYDVENEDAVEEWLEDAKENKGQPYDISVITSDYGCHFTVCEVQ